MEGSSRKYYPFDGLKVAPLAHPNTPSCQFRLPLYNIALIMRSLIKP